VEEADVEDEEEEPEDIKGEVCGPSITLFKEFVCGCTMSLITVRRAGIAILLVVMGFYG
jgi:hypothetical protein